MACQYAYEPQAVGEDFLNNLEGCIACASAHCRLISVQTNPQINPSHLVNTSLSVTSASALPMLVNSEATLSTVMIYGNTGGASGGGGGSYYGGGYYNRFGPYNSPTGNNGSGGGHYYYGYGGSSYGGGYGSDVYGGMGSSSGYGSGSGSYSYSAIQFDPFYNPVVSFNLTLPAVSASLYPGGAQGLIQVGIRVRAALKL